ncbi:MAG: uroporphyrinogen-III C-methyltransferase [Brevinema sp.]
MISLVGAGMGEDDLITLKAQKVLAHAEVVVYDRLIDKRILLYAPPEALFIRAGKAPTDGGFQQTQINQLLIDLGKKYSRVVRLHGGDPFIFGRGGEEIEILQKENIPVEIIPGVSSIHAAAAYAGIPVTHREYNSEFHVFTAHKKDHKSSLNFKEIAQLNGTLVFVMGSKYIASIAENLIAFGKAPQTPLCLVYSAATPKQKIVFGTLAEAEAIMHREKFHSPLVILVGEGISDIHQWNTPPKTQMLFVGESRSAERFIEQSDLPYRVIPLPILKTQVNPLNLTPDLFSTAKAVLFTSPSAVHYAYKNMPFHLWGSILLGAIGETTAQTLVEYGRTADFITHHGKEELLKEASALTHEGDKILICGSQNQQDTIELANREVGFLPVYSVESIPWAKEVLEDVSSQCTCAIFTSGVGVDTYFDRLEGTNPNFSYIFALGSTAQKALAKRGLTSLSPEHPNFSELIKFIKESLHDSTFSSPSTKPICSESCR